MGKMEPPNNLTETMELACFTYYSMIQKWLVAIFDLSVGEKRAFCGISGPIKNIGTTVGPPGIREGPDRGP
jgi:hypothetical protein